MPMQYAGEADSMVQALGRLGIRPPRPFDPRRDKNFDSWLSRIDYHFALTGLDEDRKTSALLLQLDLDAFEMAKNLGIKPDTPYVQAVMKLRDHYAITETVEELRERFYGRRQQQTEALETFARDLRVVGNRAFKDVPADVLELLLVRQFIDGIRNPGTRERLILKRESNLTNAIHFARLSETATKVARAGPRSFSSINEVTDSIDTGSTFVSRGFRGGRGRGGFPRFQSGGFSRGATGFSPSGRGDKLCYLCGKPGHFKRECPERGVMQNPRGGFRNFRSPGQQFRGNRFRPGFRRPFGAAGRGGSRPVGSTNAVDFEYESEYSGPDVSVVTNSNGKQGKGSLVVSGIINGTPVEDLLLDTGSCVTIIREDLWKRTRATLDPRQKPSFRTANGAPLSVLGVSSVDVQVAGLKVSHPVYVVKDTVHEFIIGSDFLENHSCDVLYSAGVLSAGGKTVPLRVSKLVVNVIASFSLGADVLIAPHSEMVLEGELIGLTDTQKTSDQLLLSGDRGDERFLVARTLVRTGTQSSPLLVANLTAAPISLHRGMRIARVEEAESLEVPDGRVKAPGQAVRSEASHVLHDPVDVAIRSVPQTLGNEEYSKLLALLAGYRSVFSTGSTDLGRTRLVYHTIETGQERPIRQAPRRLPYHQKAEVQEEVKKLTQAGVVSESQSPWSSPIVVVRKKTGEIRLCVDYRKLNDVTRKDAHPLPRIEDMFDTLSGSRYFSTLDLASGYHQVEVEPKDRDKTAFVTPFGLYQYNVMPFGLCNAPATFQRLMALVFSGMMGETCLAYLDDIIIFSKTFDEHLIKLEKVFNRLLSANLKLKAEKCSFCQPKVHFLGHIVSAEGLATDPEKITKIKNWPVPRNVNEVRSFMGYATYYRRFIPNFAQLMAPINDLVQKDRAFSWNQKCQEAFDLVKRKFTDAITLRYPDFSQEFLLDTDASDFGIGAVLSQLVAGVERPVAYYSRSLSKPERRYSTTRKELLALVDSVKHFRCYLYGRKFRARTDHAALQWLHNFKEPTGQVARWLERLAEFQYEIVHRAGRIHSNADALSRYPQVDSILPVVPNPAGDMEIPNDINWLPATKPEDIRKMQEHDAVLTHVLKWLDESRRPPQEEIASDGRSVRFYWARFDQLRRWGACAFIEDYKEDGGASHLRLLVPLELRQTVLELLHSKPAGGHFGVKKTVEKLKFRFHWPELKADVVEWCRRCPDCCRRKTNKKNRGKMHPSQVGLPMERVAMDIMGPLPRTERGNKYVLAVIDYFTKWAEAYALPNQEAATVARVLVNEFFSRFGVPHSLHTDQGTNFDSALMKELCLVFGVEKTRTTAYHPQSDGLVERLNRTIGTLIAVNVQDAKRDWDLNLGLVMMAYRSSVQETTGYTPFMLMFGREMRVPVDVMFGLPPSATPNRDDFVEGIRFTLNNVYDRVRDNIGSAQKRQKELYDRRSHGTAYKEGDRVWLYVPAIPKGSCPKFHRPWMGPFKVEKRISDVTYRIKNEQTGKVKVVHFDRLKICPGPWVPKIPEEVHESTSDDSDEEAPIVLPRVMNAAALPDLDRNQHEDIDLQPDPIPRAEVEKLAPQAGAGQVPPAAPPIAQPRAVKPVPIEGENERTVAMKQYPRAEFGEAARFPQEQRGFDRVVMHPQGGIGPKAPAPIRASSRSNKGVPAARYGYTSAMFLSVVLCLVSPSLADDVLVFQQLGAVAEKAGQIAVQEGFSQFSMILRFDLDLRPRNFTTCVGAAYRILTQEMEQESIYPKWLEESMLDGDLSNRQKRFLPLLIAGGLFAASSVLSLAGSIYSVVEVRNLKSSQDEIRSHIEGLRGFVEEGHQDMIKISKLTRSLYEYTHGQFVSMGSRIRELDCQMEGMRNVFLYLNSRSRLVARLYNDISSAVLAIFSHKLSPPLLSIKSIRSLMNRNMDFFRDTVYQDNPFLLYRFASVYPVLPLANRALGYVLRVPRIMRPSVTVLYRILNLGRSLEIGLARAKLPEFAINRNGSIFEIDPRSCDMLDPATRVCQQEVPSTRVECVVNLTSCTWEFKRESAVELIIGAFGYLVANRGPCELTDAFGHQIVVAVDSGFIFIPYNVHGLVMCPPATVLQVPDRHFEYTMHYSSELNFTMPTFPEVVLDKDWKDQGQLEQLIGKIEREKLVSSESHWARGVPWLVIVALLLGAVGTIISLFNLLGQRFQTVIRTRPEPIVHYHVGEPERPVTSTEMVSPPQAAQPVPAIPSPEIHQAGSVMIVLPTTTITPDIQPEIPAFLPAISSSVSVERLEASGAALRETAVVESPREPACEANEVLLNGLRGAKSFQPPATSQPAPKLGVGAMRSEAVKAKNLIVEERKMPDEGMSF